MAACDEALGSAQRLTAGEVGMEYRIANKVIELQHQNMLAKQNLGLVIGCSYNTMHVWSLSWYYPIGELIHHSHISDYLDQKLFH